MALSCLSIISSQQLTNVGSGKTTYSFTFPTSLGNPTFSNPTYTYSGGSGSTTYLNGNYVMCSSSSNDTIRSTYAMCNNGSSIYMSGVSGSNNYYLQYVASNGTVTSYGPLTYSRSCYITTAGGTLGNYQGGTGSYSYFQTFYNGGSYSYGDYVEFIFPFNFIFQKLSLAANATGFGPKFVRLLGSNDYLTWTSITSLTCASWTTTTLINIIDVTATNTTAYKIHRIVWESDYGNNTMILKTCIIDGQVVIG